MEVSVWIYERITLQTVGKASTKSPSEKFFAHLTNSMASSEKNIGNKRQ